jgi:hypothetical protein
MRNGSFLIIPKKVLFLNTKQEANTPEETLPAVYQKKDKNAGARKAGALIDCRFNRLFSIFMKKSRHEKAGGKIYL